MTAKRFWMPVDIAKGAVVAYLAGCKENGVSIIDPSNLDPAMVKRAARELHQLMGFRQSEPVSVQLRVWAKFVLVAALTVEGDDG